MRTVEAEFARNIARSCNLLEQALPKPALRPSVVAIVDSGGRTIFGANGGCTRLNSAVDLSVPNWTQASDEKVLSRGGW